MKQVQFWVICALLVVVIVLLCRIIYRHMQLVEDFYNTSQYLSDKIDVLTSKVNGLQA